MMKSERVAGEWPRAGRPPRPVPIKRVECPKLKTLCKLSHTSSSCHPSPPYAAACPCPPQPALLPPSPDSCSCSACAPRQPSRPASHPHTSAPHPFPSNPARHPAARPAWVPSHIDPPRPGATARRAGRGLRGRLGRPACPRIGRGRRALRQNGRRRAEHRQFPGWMPGGSWVAGASSSRRRGWPLRLGLAGRHATRRGRRARRRLCPRDRQRHPPGGSRA